VQQRYHRESDQYGHLETHQYVPHPLAGGDARLAIAMNTRVVTMFTSLLAARSAISGLSTMRDEQIEELDRDCRQIGQHDDGCDHHAPSAHTADVGPECFGGSGE